MVLILSVKTGVGSRGGGGKGWSGRLNEIHTKNMLVVLERPVELADLISATEGNLQGEECVIFFFPFAA